MPAPTATRPQPRTASKPSAATPATTGPATTGLATRPGAAPAKRRLSGPRFFNWLRFSLITVTLVAAVLGIVCAATTHAQQEATAGQITYAHCLRQLDTTTAEAQSSLLASLLDPSSQTGADQWEDYQASLQEADGLLLTAAANSDWPADLTDTSAALTAWAIPAAQARQEALGQGLSPETLTSLTEAFTAVGTSLDTHLTAPATARVTPLMIVSLAVAALALVLFLTGLVLTARRTHRVINPGLAIGLLLVIGLAAVIGSEVVQAAGADRDDSLSAHWSGLASQVWTSRQLAALGVLDPSSTDGEAALDLVASLQTESAASPALADQTQALADRLTAIGQASGADRIGLITDASVWQDPADSLGRMIDANRPTTKVTVFLWPTVLIAAFGLGAIAATLAGIHARTKEYT